MLITWSQAPMLIMWLIKWALQNKSWLWHWGMTTRKIYWIHISVAQWIKNNYVSRYLMEDVDESSSDYNIVIDGIRDFSASPHHLNKKAYSFRMGKGHKIGIFPTLPSTCRNFRRVSTLWLLNSSRQQEVMCWWTLFPLHWILLSSGPRCLSITGNPTCIYISGTYCLTNSSTSTWNVRAVTPGTLQGLAIWLFTESGVTEQCGLKCVQHNLCCPKQSNGNANQLAFK